MNKKEQLIISHLRKDARTSLASISEEINTPVSTIYDNINRLKNKEVIKKFTALVDFAKLGYHHQSKMALRIPKEDKIKLLNFLQKHPSVNSLHEIDNGFNFFIETIHPTIKENLEFKDELYENFSIISIQEYQVVKEIVREKLLH